MNIFLIHKNVTNIDISWQLCCYSSDLWGRPTAC